jgi:hypothetical protein
MKLIQFYLINHGWEMPSYLTIGVIKFDIMEEMVLLFIQMLVGKWLWNNTKQLEVANAMPFCKGWLMKKQLTFMM